MAELRKHPLTNDWIMVASHRQNRPQMPKDYCPFCPGSGKVPDKYTVHKYDNDFPALSQNPPAPDAVADDFFVGQDAGDACFQNVHIERFDNVIVRLDFQTMNDVLLVVQCRKKIKYVFIFENRGDVVGVTMPHPHGQIYGYSFMPKKLELEVENAKKHMAEKGKCLFCDMLDHEIAFKKRIIFKNEHFTVFLPFFSEYPYGIYIMSNAHKADITEFTDEERTALAETLRQATGTLDALFGYQFPYMMCMYNQPVNEQEDYGDIFHWHIAFYPPMRSADKVKFNASSETGAWAHCNPTCPEDTAIELRQAYARFMGK